MVKTAQELKKVAYDNPVWLMFECDNGNRWTCVKNGICDDQIDNDFCSFSGCKENSHRIHLKGETADRITAHNWFRNIKETKSGVEVEG
jgi:hypothetical protein